MQQNALTMQVLMVSSCIAPMVICVHSFWTRQLNSVLMSIGGTHEHCCRFTLDAVDAISKVYSPDRIGIKLTLGGGMIDVGDTVDIMEPQYSYLLQQLDQRGLSYVQLVRLGICV